jgi:Flp pilus assembly protein TadG
MTIIETLKLTSARLSHLAGRIRDDIKGVSAVEFAIIAPMLVTLYLGAAETALGVSVNRKVSRVSSTISDLVAQAQTVSADDIDGIMNAAFAIMAPTDATPLRIVLTGVEIDADAKTKVIWSRKKGSGASAASVGSTYPIPTAIKIADSFVVVAQVQYDYAPAMGGQIVGSIQFDKKNYLRPRIGSNVACTGC